MAVPNQLDKLVYSIRLLGRRVNDWMPSDVARMKAARRQIVGISTKPPTKRGGLQE